MNKNNKIAITGGSEGLGLELAKYFNLTFGTQVAICGSRKEIELDFKNYPGIFYQSIDLKNANGPNQFLDFVQDTLGEIDIFLNNAVSVPDENILTDSRDFILEQFLINTVVPVEITQNIYARLNLNPTNHKTSLIMINSEVGIQPKPILATYSSTKSALLSYTKSLATYSKNSALSICSLILGPLATPYYIDMYKTSAEKMSKSPEELISEGLNRRFPTHTYSNLISVEEVAKTILFLHDLGPTKNGCSWRLDSGVIPVAF